MYFIDAVVLWGGYSKQYFIDVVACFSRGYNKDYFTDAVTCFREVIASTTLLMPLLGLGRL